MTNIFTELHHGDLFYSLHKLFVERLGMNLYRPIGTDWFKKGFWKIAEPYGNAPDTIDQYLGIPKKTWSKDKEPIQKYGDVKLIDGIYHIPAKIGSGEYIQKAITFDKFLKMDFDIIIATYLGHERTYARLVHNHKPNAVYVRQIGNTGVRPVYAQNVLLATNTPMPPKVNYIKYHPEHYEEYCYTPPTNHKVVKSFLTHIHLMPDYPLWVAFERMLPEFTFKMHGIDGRDGVISGDKMPQVMKESGFVWHVKHTGCGGFVPRQAMACGRPVIIKKSYTHAYHTLCRDLFEDSVNCIDLDLGFDRALKLLRELAEPDNHVELCKSTAKSFKEKVNFSQEAIQIKEFLEKLK